jgi:phosphinothricin acetyltransferase
MQFEITPLTSADWPAVRAIYLEGLATGLATFETQAPEWPAWDSGHHPFARLAARGEQGLLAWVALSPVSARAVYRGVADVSIYVAAAARGQGIGRALLTRLVTESEAQGIWTLQSSLFAENQASLALHTACGFRPVGRRERIAQRDGLWHDTLLLERRSTSVGR